MTVTPIALLTGDVDIQAISRACMVSVDHVASLFHRLGLQANSGATSKLVEKLKASLEYSFQFPGFDIAELIELDGLLGAAQRAALSRSDLSDFGNLGDFTPVFVLLYRDFPLFPDSVVLPLKSLVALAALTSRRDERDSVAKFVAELEKVLKKKRSQLERDEINRVLDPLLTESDLSQGLRMVSRLYRNSVGKGQGGQSVTNECVYSRSARKLALNVERLGEELNLSRDSYARTINNKSFIAFDNDGECSDLSVIVSVPADNDKVEAIGSNVISILTKNEDLEHKEPEESPISVVVDDINENAYVSVRNNETYIGNRAASYLSRVQDAFSNSRGLFTDAERYRLGQEMGACIRRNEYLEEIFLILMSMHLNSDTSKLLKLKAGVDFDECGFYRKFPQQSTSSAVLKKNESLYVDHITKAYIPYGDLLKSAAKSVGVVSFPRGTELGPILKLSKFDGELKNSRFLTHMRKVTGWPYNSSSIKGQLKLHLWSEVKNINYVALLFAKIDDAIPISLHYGSYRTESVIDAFNECVESYFSPNEVVLTK